MNNVIRESNSMAASPSRSAHLDPDPLHALKRDLLKAEVTLAKARAAAAGAEVDIKVLTARLKAITK